MSSRRLRISRDAWLYWRRNLRSSRSISSSVHSCAWSAMCSPMQGVAPHRLGGLLVSGCYSGSAVPCGRVRLSIAKRHRMERNAVAPRRVGVSRGVHAVCPPTRPNGCDPLSLEAKWCDGSILPKTARHRLRLRTVPCRHPRLRASRQQPRRASGSAACEGWSPRPATRPPARASRPAPSGC